MKTKKIMFWVGALFLITLASGSGALYAQSRITCSSCNGSGQIADPCPARCHNGAIICNTCHGGRRTRDRCASGCSNGFVQRSVPITCTNCNGARSFRQNQPINCTSCRGGRRPVARTVTGRDGTPQQQVTYVNCDRCRGTGQLDNFVNVACRPCGGRGTTGTETVRERCLSGCDNGFITRDCSACRGDGSVMCQRCQGFAHVRVNCRRCNGAGTVFAAN